MLSRGGLVVSVQAAPGCLSYLTVTLIAVLVYLLRLLPVSLGSRNWALFAFGGRFTQVAY